MGNVHYVGAEPLTFERIEEILTGNMKLELTPEVKERIQRCRDYLDRKRYGRGCRKFRYHNL